MLNQDDVARRQIAFIGFPEGVAWKNKLNIMKPIGDHFLSAEEQSQIVYERFFKGPEWKREATNNCFMQFPTRDACRLFLNQVKEAGGKAEKLTAAHLSFANILDKDKSVVIKPAQTQINGKRNWALRTAEKMLKDVIKRDSITAGKTEKEQKQMQIRA